jgi:hypothetical protein
MKTNYRLPFFYIFYNFSPNDDLLDWNMQRFVEKVIVYIIQRVVLRELYFDILSYMRQYLWNGHLEE